MPSTSSPDEELEFELELEVALDIELEAELDIELGEDSLLFEPVLVELLVLLELMEESEPVLDDVELDEVVPVDEVLVVDELDETELDVELEGEPEDPPPQATIAAQLTAKKANLSIVMIVISLGLTPVSVPHYRQSNCRPQSRTCTAEAQGT